MVGTLKFRVVWALVCEWFTRMTGPSVKTRLLDLLEQQVRGASMERDQTAHEREQFSRLLVDLQASNERLHQATTQMVGELSRAVLANGEAFNKYLDLITPTGEPQVRFMTEAREAKLEQVLRGANPDSELPPTVVPDQLLESLLNADDIHATLRDFVGDI